MRKRLLAIVATVAMVVAMTPAMVFGASGLPDADPSTPKVIELDGSIKLTGDVTLAEDETIVVKSGKTVVLDLNGYTISQEKACTGSYQMINNDGNLTITGNGKLSFKDTGIGDPSFGWGSYTIRNAGTLVVENGTIEHLGEQNPGNGQPNVHMYCAIFQYSGSTTINGGIISTPTYRSARLWSGEMIINGGEFDGRIWVQCVNDAADLTINGGTLSPNGNDSESLYIGNASKDAKVSITGGTFETAIGAGNPNQIAGAITGGVFEGSAADNTDEALFADTIEDQVIVSDESGTVKSTAFGEKAVEEVLKDVEDGDKITVIADSDGKIEAPAGTKVENNTGDEINVNGTALADGKTIEIVAKSVPEKSPNTGDNMAPFAVAGLALAAMAAAVVARRRYN